MLRHMVAESQNDEIPSVLRGAYDEEEDFLKKAAFFQGEIISCTRTWGDLLGN
jgi:hypothetical protein